MDFFTVQFGAGAGVGVLNLDNAVAELAFVVEGKKRRLLSSQRTTSWLRLCSGTTARAVTLMTLSLSVVGRALPTRGQLLTVLSRLPEKKRSAGPQTSAGHPIAVVDAAALVFGFELAAGMSGQQLVVGAGGQEAQFLLLEQECGDGSFVEAVGGAEIEVGLVLRLEDADDALDGAGHQPLSGGVGRQDGASVRQRQRLEYLAVLAGDDVQFGAGQHAEAVAHSRARARGTAANGWPRAERAPPLAGQV